MYQKEKKLSSKLIFDGNVVKLYLDEVELDNGYKATREYIKHPGGVCVAAVDEEDNIYMVEQYRYPFGRVLTEVPAGKLEQGEDPKDCGIRELKEEVGAEAESFEYLGCLYPTIAYDTETIHIFLARGLSFSEQQAHRYIEKQAMDTRSTKLDVALKIIKMYDNQNNQNIN